MNIINKSIKTFEERYKMVNEKYEAQSKRMHDLWNNESSRTELIANMREAGKKRRKHKDIDVRQTDDYKEYQKLYQRKYRLAHPDYYNNRRATKKNEENYENDISEIKNTLKKMQEDIKRLEAYPIYENCQSCSVPPTKSCSEEELRINN